MFYDMALIVDEQVSDVVWKRDRLYYYYELNKGGIDRSH